MLEWIKTNPLVAAAIAGITVLMVGNPSQILTWLKQRFLPAVTPTIPTPPTLNLVPTDGAISEASLSPVPRQLAFYYVEQLRAYSTSVGNAKAATTIDTLIADLFTGEKPTTGKPA